MNNIPPILSVVLVFFVVACQQAPLPAHSMQADHRIYDQIGSTAFLKHKIKIDEVKYEGNDPAIAPAFAEAKTALSDSLALGGYIADEGHAEYLLTASIRDASLPLCLLGHCETGTAINYTLMQIKSENTVYDDMLVVPYSKDVSAFSTNMREVQRQALGAAVGENFSHLLHVLSTKKEADLKEPL